MTAADTLDPGALNDPPAPTPRRSGRALPRRRDPRTGTADGAALLRLSADPTARTDRYLVAWDGRTVARLERVETFGRGRITYPWALLDDAGRPLLADSSPLEAARRAVDLLARPSGGLAGLLAGNRRDCGAGHRLDLEWSGPCPWCHGVPRWS